MEDECLEFSQINFECILSTLGLTRSPLASDGIMRILARRYWTRDCLLIMRQGSTSGFLKKCSIVVLNKMLESIAFEAPIPIIHSFHRTVAVSIKLESIYEVASNPIACRKGNGNWVSAIS